MAACSLKHKLARNLVANLLIVMSALLLVLYFSMQQLLVDYMLTRLQHDAESLISILEEEPTRQWRIDSTRMSTVYDRVKSGHYYRIVVNDQVIRSRSLFDADFPVTGSDKNLPGHFLIEGPWQQTWLIWRQLVTKNSQPVELWVAEDIGPIRQNLLTYTLFGALLIIIATILLILMQQRTLARAFHIFDWLGRNIAAVRHGQTEKSAQSVPSEIMPLIDQIELLVNQLHNRIERTRHAIGNLAHELKRPLQLLSLQPEINDNQLTREAVTEIQKVMERELRRARISGAESSNGHFDLAMEAPHLIRVLSRIYPDIDIEFDPGADISTALDRDDLLELTGNLMDNACKHARHKVRLAAERSDAALEIIIEDDGEGIPNEQIEQLVKRGNKLDESVQGHGLGLSISREIVDSYFGELSLADSSLGGLKVRVLIPMQQRVN